MRVPEASVRSTTITTTAFLLRTSCKRERDSIAVKRVEVDLRRRRE